MNHVRANSLHPKIPRPKPRPSEQDLDSDLVHRNAGYVCDAVMLLNAGITRVEVGYVGPGGATCHTNKGVFLAEWPFIIHAIHPEYGHPVKASELIEEVVEVARQSVRTVFYPTPPEPEPVIEYPEDQDWACEEADTVEITNEETDWGVD